MYSHSDKHSIHPYPLTPSGKFEGNDGKWSTFSINIGDDGSGQGQNFNVLISTSSPLSLVPKNSAWCNNQNCAEHRGVGIFNAKQPLGFEPSASKAWKEQGLYSIPFPYWWTRSKRNGIWGTDNVGLGQSSARSPILPRQWVVQNDFDELFMGSFGLAAGEISLGNNAVQSPFLTNFAAARQIPSVSYGYSTGASYRESAVF